MYENKIAKYEGLINSCNDVSKMQRYSSRLNYYRNKNQIGGQVEISTNKNNINNNIMEEQLSQINLTLLETLENAKGVDSSNKSIKERIEQLEKLNKREFNGVNARVEELGRIYALENGTTLGKLISGISGATSDVVEGVVDVVKESSEGIYDAVSGVVTGAFDALKNVGEAVTGASNDDVQENQAVPEMPEGQDLPPVPEMPPVNPNQENQTGGYKNRRAKAYYYCDASPMSTDMNNYMGKNTDGLQYGGGDSLNYTETENIHNNIRNLIGGSSRKNYF